jgi:hypothetical protein
MSTRSSIIKRSLLPLAPLATLAFGGCGMLGMGGHPHASLPTEPQQEASPPTNLATHPKPAADTLNPDAEKSLVEFADRLANLEKADKIAGKRLADDTTSPVVLASDQHVVSGDQPATATPAPAASPAGAAVTPVTATAVKPPEKATAGVPPTAGPVAPDALAATATPPVAAAPTAAQLSTAKPTVASTGAMAALSAETKDITPGLAAMGAMTATASPSVATIANNTAVLPETNVATSGAEPAIDPVLDLLRRRVQTRPQQLNYSLALALLETAEMRKGDDPVFATLNPSDQKLISDLTNAVEAVSAQPAAAGTPLADRAGPLLAASQKWQVDGDLKLPRLSLATRVDSFGVYTPIEPRFEYGRRQTVIIYCEVANFAAKRGDDGWYQTVLSQQDTLTTDDGLLVWRPNPEDVEDRSMNQRKDFYLVKKLTLPENLAIGKYTLKMSVTDKLAKKRAEVTMPIEIVGK